MSTKIRRVRATSLPSNPRPDTLYEIGGMLYLGNSPLSGLSAVRKSIAFFGSSSTQRCGDAVELTLDSYGYLGWYHALSRNAFDVHEISGVAGEFGDSQLARYLAKIAEWTAAPKRPDGVVLQLFQNDSDTGQTVSATTARWEAAIAATKSAGIQPIVYLPTPVAALDAAKRAHQVRVIQWLYDLCERDKSLLMADTPKYICDPGSSNYAARAGYQSTDNIHLSVRGANAAGLALLEGTQPWLGSPRVSAFAGGAYDATNNPGGNLLPVASFARTLDANSVPAGWTRLSTSIDTANTALVARDQIDPNQWYRVRLNLGAGVQYLTQDTAIIGAGNFEVLVEVVVDSTLSAGLLKNVWAQIRNSDSSTAKYGMRCVVSADNQWPTGVFPMVYKMGRVAIDPKGAAMRFAICVEGSAAGGTVDIYLRYARVRSVS